MTEPLTLAKLIIMYMLGLVDFPLTKAQLYDFILEKEYTNYFTLQTATYELIESKFVEVKTTHSSTLMSLTEEGRNALKLFRNRISDGIKDEITAYFEANKLKINNEISVMSNYYRTTSGDYVADLTAKDHSTDLLGLKLYLPTEESAETICNHWKEKSQEIYSYILENLL